MRLLPKLLFVSVLIGAVTPSFSQTTLEDSLRLAFAKIDSLRAATTVPKPQNSFNIGLDMRTRSEFRHGYRVIPTEDTSAAFFTNQRTRVNLDFKSKKIDVFISLQDTRIWGQQDPRATTPSSTVGSYFFEAYAEPKFNDKLSLRIGRQRIIYDNQRLFAENDWRLQGNSHDAFRLIYNNKINLNTELTFAFNQSAENTFTTSYKPNGFANYKTLLVHYLNYKMSKNFTLTTINTGDGFQSSNPLKYTTTYMRYTTGGRLEYSSYNWYATFSGYYQFGKDSSGKKLGAYYIQPELRYTGKKLTARLGLEYMSGSDTSTHPEKDENFVPLYGVAHRFMGNMDFFTTFPADVNGAGLFNPYLFFQFQNTSKKWTVRLENHLFYSQSDFVYKGVKQDRYLGFENDWRVNYRPNNFLDAEFGFCWAAVTNSMVLIKKAGDATTTPYWTYLSLKFTPTLLKLNF